MDPFATHLPLLGWALRRAWELGPILELGCGHYSTPMLHMVCRDRYRLLSADSNESWVKQFAYLGVGQHKVEYVPDWAAWDGIEREGRWQVVLLDSAPSESRAPLLRRLKGRALLVVAHDTEAPHYGMEPELARWKYRYDYKAQPTWATVVSDIIDVAQDLAIEGEQLR